MRLGGDFALGCPRALQPLTARQTPRRHLISLEPPTPKFSSTLRTLPVVLDYNLHSATRHDEFHTYIP
jgi:hypothetical protein